MSKQLINIGGDFNKGDDFYRYKRNIVEIIWENINGIQTRIKNLEVIAKQLGIQSEILTKYLQKKIGANITGNTIKGKIDVDTIEKHFEQYIKNYVLCPKCRLPEWTGKLCKACGFSCSQPKKLNNKVESLMTEDENLADENKNFVSESDREISKIMHFMYDLRETDITKDQFAWIDKALNRCWIQPDNCNWVEIIFEINKKFKKIGLPEYLK